MAVRIEMERAIEISAEAPTNKSAETQQPSETKAEAGSTPALNEKTKENEHDINLKRKIVLIDISILISLLVEDLFALFWQSDDISDRTVFWIFYGFTTCSGLSDMCFVMCVMACCSNERTRNIGAAISTGAIELVQAILFIIYCDGIQVYPVFILFFLIQISFEGYKVYIDKDEVESESNEIDNENDDNENDDDDETTASEAETINGLLWRCCYPLWIGFVVMPLIYFNSGPFRSQWFDIYATFLIWFGTVAATFQHILTPLQRVIFPMVVCLINGVLVFGLCWIYVLDAYDPDTHVFDVVFSVIIICCFPFCCCSIIFTIRQTIREAKWEKEIYQFILEYNKSNNDNNNGCSVEYIKSKMSKVKEKHILKCIGELKFHEAISESDNLYYANEKTTKWV